MTKVEKSATVYGRAKRRYMYVDDEMIFEIVSSSSTSSALARQGRQIIRGAYRRRLHVCTAYRFRDFCQSVIVPRTVENSVTLLAQYATMKIAKMESNVRSCNFYDNCQTSIGQVSRAVRCYKHVAENKLQQLTSLRARSAAVVILNVVRVIVVVVSLLLSSSSCRVTRLNYLGLITY